MLKSKLFENFENFEKLEKSAKMHAINSINEQSLNDAIATIYTKDGIKWAKLVEGVTYDTLVIDDSNNIDVAIKTVKVGDVFILKANSKSSKHVIPGDLYTMLECFGVNLSNAYFNTLDNAIAKMHVYAKYIPTMECFVNETCTSNNQLEKQLNEFITYFYGENTDIKAKKCYVVHLKQQFTKVTNTGYRNGNAINLLQLVINHVADCKNNTVYVAKSGLNSHKAPKDNKK